MSSATPLPTLFGRFTAILKDHEHLGVTLRQLQKMCALLQTAEPALPTDLSPQRLFHELLADLKDHFAAEESAAYFGTVAEESPALASRIAALKWEHLSLLATVEKLLASAEDRDGWAELLAPTERLVAQLAQHERSEAVLLRQFFSFNRG